MSQQNSTFTTSTGLVIELRAVDPMFLQKVISSVQMPKRPTYTTRTVTGRVEQHTMDETSAAQTPGGMSQWTAYMEERSLASMEQNKRLMNALFYMGTACTIPEDNWEKRWRFLEIEVPDDPDERRAFYLTSELPAKDQVELMSAIMKLTGVDEEVLKQAEEAFRGAVRDESS